MGQAYVLGSQQLLRLLEVALIEANNAYYAGGAVYAQEDVQVQASDCLISSNTALEYGGGVGVTDYAQVGTVSNCPCKLQVAMSAATAWIV